MRRYAVVALTGMVIWGCGARAPVGINSVTPPVGPTGGGTSITISGWGFTAPVSVTIGGSAAGSVVLVSESTITCNTPAHAAGYVSITVSSNGGADIVTRANVFRYVVPPNITSATPNQGPSAGNTPVGISGTDFQDGILVYFGGVLATNIVWNNSAFVTCVTPAGTDGQVDIKVVNPDLGEDTLTNGYTYHDPPGIGSLNPTIMTTSGGALSILGTNFYGTTVTTTVNIGGAAVTVTSVNTAQIQCTVPAGTAGHYDVEVINPDGQSDTVEGGLLIYDNANTLFVVDTGSDSLGDGSLGNPWKSVGKGLSEADTQSKTLVVLAGTYSTAATSELFPLSVPDGVTAYGETGNTIVDGGGAASLIFDLDTLASTTTIVGFTVQNASSSSGTGVLVDSCTDAVLSLMTIDSCRLGIQQVAGALSLDRLTISNNDYGGIYATTGCALTISNSTISDNGYLSSGTSCGGMTVLDSTSTVSITDTEFLRNTAVSSSAVAGGGAAIAGATGQLVRCTFSENVADYGGAVFIQDVDWDVSQNRQLFFINCLFTENEADTLAGSTGSSVYIYAWFDDVRGIEFTNCVFDGDVVPTTGGAVALYVRKTSGTYDFLAQPVFRNCIFNNSNGSALHAENYQSPHSTPLMGVFALWYNAFNGNLHNLSYNNVMYKDAATDINALGTTPLGSPVPLIPNVGNIVIGTSDTLFAGAGDYQLDAASPCVDAGDPDAAYNDTDTSRNDMGIYGGPQTW